MRYQTKTKRTKFGYDVNVTDTQGIKPETLVQLQFSNDSDMGKGWRTFFNFDGDWECHDAPYETKKDAIETLQKYGA